MKDMWMKGTDIRDCIMIKKMNMTAKAVIDTPVGHTREIKVNNTLKQGTVTGPDVCKVSMDYVNNRSLNNPTFYGPELEIQAMALMDDVASAGSVKCANNTVASCSVMEERKRMLFNMDPGKSAYMVINEKKGKYEEVVEKVKDGRFQKVMEYKYLGVWLDSSGRYGINIDKNKKRIPFMILTIKGIANDRTMGRLTTVARIHLIETIIVPTIIYGVEAYPNLTKGEEKELEKMQGRIMRECLEVPPSTSYEAMLIETGQIESGTKNSCYIKI